MSNERYGYQPARRGRPPSPHDLCNALHFPRTVTAIFQREMRGGCAVLLISYEPFAVIPVTCFDREGRVEFFPIDGLRPTSRGDLPFRYEVRPDKELRTAADPRHLAERWVRAYLDQPPRQAQRV